MPLWVEWFRCVYLLRSARSRTRTFLWLVLSLLGFSIRSDLAGVTSFVRAAFLPETAYRHLLHSFHSQGVSLDCLTTLWVDLVRRLFRPLCFEDFLLLVADGLQVGKEGKKMPAVKSLHQESSDNTKPEFIMGHSFQALSLLVRGVFPQAISVPLTSRIHEAVVLCNADRRTLLDRLVCLFLPVAPNLRQKAILIVDAFYASAKVILPLLAKGHELLTRVRSNGVAYQPAAVPSKRKRGRPRLYGQKVRLKDLWNKDGFQRAKGPVYGEQDVWIRYLCVDLLWRPVGRIVRFVLADHPTRGRLILMTTCRAIQPIDVIRLYGYRFKIEVGFKQALRTIGAYAYHFWMEAMTPIRRKSGNQHLHHKSKEYRAAVQRKIGAYHLHVQIGCIAQGLLLHLAVNFRDRVWGAFRGWLRTMNTHKEPSELVVAHALRDSLPDSLVHARGRHELAKILEKHADLDRVPGVALSA